MHALGGREVKANFSFVCMCLGVALAKANDTTREDRADLAAPLLRTETLRGKGIGQLHEPWANLIRSALKHHGAEGMLSKIRWLSQSCGKESRTAKIRVFQWESDFAVRARLGSLFSAAELSRYELKQSECFLLWRARSQTCGAGK